MDLLKASITKATQTKYITPPTEEDGEECNKDGHDWRFVEQISKKYLWSTYECKRCGKQQLM